MWIQFSEFIVTTGCVGIAYQAIKNIEEKDNINIAIIVWVKRLLVMIVAVQVVAISLRAIL